jgi:PAS domain S-box-containing protein
MADAPRKNIIDTQHSLEQNLKALRLLHEIADIASWPDKTLSDKLREIVKIISPAFGNPDENWAQITYAGEHYKTSNFRDTGRIFSADIKARGEKIGALEIGYPELAPASDIKLVNNQDILLIRAITERLGLIIENSRAQQALQESEEKFSKAFRLSPAVIAITSLEDGRVIEVNDNFTRFTGYSREEALKLPPMNEAGWQENKRTPSFIDQVKKTGSLHNIETVLEIKNGEKRTVLLSADTIHFSGKPCIITVTQDVTELKHNREFLESISTASPLAIYIMQDEILKYTNLQFQNLTGYSPQELPGIGLLNIVASADKETVRTSTALSLRGGKTYPCEYRIIPKNGRVKWVMQTVAPIHYDNREAILGSLMDITERKYLERKVTEYEELDKMKGDILAAVSHELRTPLAAIKGYATMMLDHHSRITSDESIESLIAINNSADVLDNLVNNLLDTSRLDSGMLELKKAPASITALIKSVVKVTSVRIITHRIMFDLPSSLPKINIDKRRIEQVLDNLVLNALGNSPPGSEIRISAVKKGRFIEVSVTDQGPSIPEKELKSVFDRMYKTENREYAGSEGMGLGLHICQRLVEAHGGHILAENEPVKGTRIRFTLPLIPAKQVQELKP